MLKKFIKFILQRAKIELILLRINLFGTAEEKRIAHDLCTMTKVQRDYLIK